MKKAYSSNPVTDCTYYPESGKYAVINNTTEDQKTTFYDIHGNSKEVIVKGGDVLWVEEK
jgi:1,3-beta-galactosyl-N-acetylhexosamine phosphorylase